MKIILILFGYFLCGLAGGIAFYAGGVLAMVAVIIAQIGGFIINTRFED